MNPITADELKLLVEQFKMRSMRDIDQIAYEWISTYGIHKNQWFMLTYCSADELADGASEWISAYGTNKVQQFTLNYCSAEDLADAAIKGWGLDPTDDYRSDLVAAFQRLKNELAATNRIQPR
jgi:hypothetical protein